MGHRTLKVGSREFVVETTPLPAVSGNFITKTFSRPSEQLLVLMPSRQFRDMALGTVWSGAVFFVIAFFVPGPGHGRFGLGVFGCAIILLGLLLWLLPRRFEFDRSKGQMQTWSLGIQTDRPLNHVLAVQLIKNPERNRFGFQYQLNVVLDDANARRNDGFKAAVRETLDARQDGEQGVVALLPAIELDIFGNSNKGVRRSPTDTKIL